MERQMTLFDNDNLQAKNRKDIGSGFVMEIIGAYKQKAVLYRNGAQIRTVDLSDRVAKRLFVVETVESGAMQSRLASALNISRQTIHNYLETKKHYGLEGLIQGYTAAEGTSLRKQRAQHKKERCLGDKARQLEEIRRKARRERQEKQLKLSFLFNGDGEARTVEKDKQPFREEHEWEASRYAGVFAYLIPLITEWKWLKLVMGYFGETYRIFMVFLLMVAHNIRSIEQLKNVYAREAGIVLGMMRLPAKPKVWEWFYSAAHKRISKVMLDEQFRYQIKSGLVDGKIWFVTWEKYADANKLAAIEDKRFASEFEFNGKKYAVFEGVKSFTYIPEESKEEEHSFTLRRIYIWNKSSNRRVCGLASCEKKQMGTEDCARAILSRWGASENTFKHMKDRHPLHYHPGFKLVESDNQEIANPEIKEADSTIKRFKRSLSKLYKKLAKTEETLKKDGKPRQNSGRECLKNSIEEQEGKLKSLKEEKAQLPERIDVSSLENYKSFKRIDDEGKYLFDFVTCSVWNARKQMVDWLRPMFNQENELVDLFYAITNCHGWIKSTKQEVIVRLEPLQQPKRRLAQEQLCRKLTCLGARTPVGKWLVIEVGESPPASVQYSCN